MLGNVELAATYINVIVSSKAIAPTVLRRTSMDNSLVVSIDFLVRTRSLTMSSIDTIIGVLESCLVFVKLGDHQVPSDRFKPYRDLEPQQDIFLSIIRCVT
jgi:hypothetical protein